MRLAIKLSSILVVGMVAILAFEVYQALRRERDFFRADMQHDAQLLGRSLMTPIADVWKTSGQQRALELIRDANQREDIMEIRWVWLDAKEGDPYRPYADRGQLREVLDGAEASLALSSPGAGARLVTYVPVVTPGGRSGALELSEPFSQLQKYNRTTLLRAFGVLGKLVLLGAGGVVLLGATLVGRPLRELVRAVRRIGQGDLQVRIHRVRHDEFGELASALNDMCRQLADSREAVRVETERRITAVEHLRHADRLGTVGKVAAGIAHEVGTPLNVIAARAKQLANGEMPLSAVRVHATTIGRQADRIAATIRQLLDFSRAGRLERGRQDLGELVQHSVALLQPLAEKHDVQLDVTVPPEPLIVMVVAQQLEQVVANLVMNALQAVAPGGHVKVRVFHSADPPDNGQAPAAPTACLSVADDGAGIAEEDVERVFEPFFTTKDVGQGTGLGLSLAHEIVREHGGRIEVTSEAGVGTCFVVHLPVPWRVQAVDGCGAPA